MDASQYIGHKKLNLNDTYFTALCSAGHKSLFGIQGSAFAIINDYALFDTLTEGGSGVDSFSETMPILLPERYEAGTLSTPAIASLNAGIEFLNNVGMDTIERKLDQMTTLAINKLKAIPTITVYGADNGIISFNVKNYTSSYVADFLDKEGFATRSGFHCAPLIHKKLGTEERGAVRVSFSYFNKENEILALYKILKTL